MHFNHFSAHKASDTSSLYSYTHGYTPLQYQYNSINTESSSCSSSHHNCYFVQVQSGSSGETNLLKLCIQYAIQIKQMASFFGKLAHIV